MKTVTVAREQARACRCGAIEGDGRARVGPGSTIPTSGASASSAGTAAAAKPSAGAWRAHPEAAAPGRGSARARTAPESTAERRTPWIPPL